ncbi:amidase [Colletotrichum scovillei]|nr:amidase [Colletotrichum scovillei]
MRSLAIILASFRLASANFVNQGQVLSLNGVSYYAGGVPVGQIGTTNGSSLSLAAAQIPGQDLFPLTIIDTSSSVPSGDELLNLTTTYDSSDDVFQSAFLHAIYLRPSTTNATAGYNGTTSLDSQLSRQGTSLVLSPKEIHGLTSSVATGVTVLSLPRGPYFVSVHTGNVYKAYRLYDDDHLAFVQGMISDEEGAFTTLPAVTENVMAKSIAVPSRLYYTETEEQPLAGLRFGVKDIFHVKGVGTSGGNRAYFYLYGRQNNTAPAVQRLIDLGAVLVGKMGTVQFANGDRPTADWVDLHAPFNPRGDGYQDPSGSSTGPGAGVGAYDWLDLAVGSDTGGSMRGPAGSQGLFGNRPSTGAISLEHVIPLSPVSDTAGMFARSGSLWAKVTQAWYPDFASKYTSYPTTLYRSTARGGAWSGGNVSEEATDVITSFVQKLEGFLQTNSTPANYTQLWSETHGEAPADVNEMLYLTYGVYVSHDQWQGLGKPFFEDYAVKFDGRQPYINPGPLARWQWGQVHSTEEAYAQGLHNISIFRSWYETEGYGRHDPESCSEGLYVYPWSVGQPAYRDVYIQPRTTPPLGFDDSSVPVMAGAPEVVVPIGEVPYNSTKSLHTEHLPVTMALRMARGCDHHLANLRESIALSITNLHCSTFSTPAFFVHVNFIKQEPKSDDGTYFMAGKSHTSNSNRIVALVRTSASRTKDDFDALAAKIEDAWNGAVKEPGKEADFDEAKRLLMVVFTPMLAIREGGC